MIVIILVLLVAVQNGVKNSFSSSSQKELKFFGFSMDPA
jgi:hypothetical protein